MMISVWVAVALLAVSTDEGTRLVFDHSPPLKSEAECRMVVDRYEALAKDTPAILAYGYNCVELKVESKQPASGTSQPQTRKHTPAPTGLINL